MFLVSGIPRASTTLVAKFLSLDESIFCYAGETHLISFLHSQFPYCSCNVSRVEKIKGILRAQLLQSMIELPKYSISQGAHPGNIVFKEKHVDYIVNEIAIGLNNQLYGKELFQLGLNVLKNVLGQVSKRMYLGEKTPDSIFAIAAYGQEHRVKNFAVVREPVGVLQSMRARVKSGDPFSAVFNGGVETNIGLYLEYSDAIITAVDKSNSHLVRFEDLALDPRSALCRMYEDFNLKPDEDVLSFVENGGNSEIADRAPMHYQRLKLKTDASGMSDVDIWKILHFTRDVRIAFGYDDSFLAEMGFNIQEKWPGPEIHKDMLLPISGFGAPGKLKLKWLKRNLIYRSITGKARFVMYFRQRRSCVLRLNFVSNFPDEVMSSKSVSLTASIQKSIRDKVSVSSGSIQSTLSLDLEDEDLQPMGKKGAYIIVELDPSLTFCSANHTPKGRDLRTLSFELIDWSVY